MLTVPTALVTALSFLEWYRVPVNNSHAEEEKNKSIIAYPIFKPVTNFDPIKGGSDEKIITRCHGTVFWPVAHGRSSGLCRAADLSRDCDATWRRSALADRRVLI